MINLICQNGNSMTDTDEGNLKSFFFCRGKMGQNSEKFFIPVGEKWESFFGSFHSCRGKTEQDRDFIPNYGFSYK